MSNHIKIMLVLVLAIFGTSLFLIAENFELRNENKFLKYQKEKCTDLGICIGDVVIPNQDAIESLNQTLIQELSFGVTVKRISADNVLTLDMNDGSYKFLADTWMKKSNCPANSLCIDLKVNVKSITIDGITTEVKDET